METLSLGDIRVGAVRLADVPGLAHATLISTGPNTATLLLDTGNGLMEPVITVNSQPQQGPYISAEQIEALQQEGAVYHVANPAGGGQPAIMYHAPTILTEQSGDVYQVHTEAVGDHPTAVYHAPHIHDQSSSESSEVAAIFHTSTTASEPTIAVYHAPVDSAPTTDNTSIIYHAPSETHSHHQIVQHRSTPSPEQPSVVYHLPALSAKPESGVASTESEQTVYHHALAVAARHSVVSCTESERTDPAAVRPSQAVFHILPVSEAYSTTFTDSHATPIQATSQQLPAHIMRIDAPVQLPADKSPPHTMDEYSSAQSTPHKMESQSEEAMDVAADVSVSKQEVPDTQPGQSEDDEDMTYKMSMQYRVQSV